MKFNIYTHKKYRTSIRSCLIIFANIYVFITSKRWARQAATVHWTAYKYRDKTVCACVRGREVGVYRMANHTDKTAVLRLAVLC